MTFANTSRGLMIPQTDFKYFKEGAMSLVFVDRARLKIWKVARADRSISRSHLEQVFRTEIDAYRIASTSPAIRDLVPTFYGVVRIFAMVDQMGNDILGEVFPDLAFQAEFIDGDFHKLSVQEEVHQTTVSASFRKHGIYYTIDSSVCLRQGRVFKVIDFATKEVELWHE